MAISTPQLSLESLLQKYRAVRATYEYILEEEDGPLALTAATMKPLSKKWLDFYQKPLTTHLISLLQCHYANDNWDGIKVASLLLILQEVTGLEASEFLPTELPEAKRIHLRNEVEEDHTPEKNLVAAELDAQIPQEELIAAALCYYEGITVQQDKQRAYRLFKQAAELGEEALGPQAAIARYFQIKLCLEAPFSTDLFSKKGMRPFSAYFFLEILPTLTFVGSKIALGAIVALLFLTIPPAALLLGVFGVIDLCLGLFASAIVLMGTIFSHFISKSLRRNTLLHRLTKNFRFIKYSISYLFVEKVETLLFEKIEKTAISLQDKKNPTMPTRVMNSHFYKPIKAAREALPQSYQKLLDHHYREGDESAWTLEESLHLSEQLGFIPTVAMPHIIGAGSAEQEQDALVSFALPARADSSRYSKPAERVLRGDAMEQPVRKFKEIKHVKDFAIRMREYYRRQGHHTRVQGNFDSIRRATQIFLAVPQTEDRVFRWEETPPINDPRARLIQYAKGQAREVEDNLRKFAEATLADVIRLGNAEPSDICNYLAILANCLREPVSTEMRLNDFDINIQLRLSGQLNENGVRPGSPILYSSNLTLECKNQSLATLGKQILSDPNLEEPSKLRRLNFLLGLPEVMGGDFIDGRNALFDARNQLLHRLLDWLMFLEKSDEIGFLKNEMEEHSWAIESMLELAKDPNEPSVKNELKAHWLTSIFSIKSAFPEKHWTECCLMQTKLSEAEAELLSLPKTEKETYAAQQKKVNTLEDKFERHFSEYEEKLNTLIKEMEALEESLAPKVNYQGFFEILDNLQVQKSILALFKEWNAGGMEAWFEKQKTRIAGLLETEVHCEPYQVRLTWELISQLFHRQYARWTEGKPEFKSQIENPSSWELQKAAGKTAVHGYECLAVIKLWMNPSNNRAGQHIFFQDVLQHCITELKNKNLLPQYLDDENLINKAYRKALLFLFIHQIKNLDLINTREYGPHCDIAPLNTEIPTFPSGLLKPNMSDAGRLANATPLFADPDFFRAIQNQEIPISFDDLYAILEETIETAGHNNPFIEKDNPCFPGLSFLLCCIFFPNFGHALSDNNSVLFHSRIISYLEKEAERILESSAYNEFDISGFWQTEAASFNPNTSDQKSLHRLKFLTRELHHQYPELKLDKKILPRKEAAAASPPLTTAELEKTRRLTEWRDQNSHLPTRPEQLRPVGCGLFKPHDQSTNGVFSAISCPPHEINTGTIKFFSDDTTRTLIFTPASPLDTALDHDTFNGSDSEAPSLE